MKAHRFGRAAAIALIALAMTPARAGDVGAGCGAPVYTRSANCRLLFRGFPITVFADAQAPGTANVHAWITINELDDPLGESSPKILECSAQAQGLATCDGGLPDQTTVIDNALLQQFHLHCWVQSNGTGAYRCISGTGR